MKVSQYNEHLLEMPEALSFDDVLLMPRHSEIESRGEVSLFSELGTVAGKPIGLDLPVISSPMDTVTESSMAMAMAKAGGMGVVHRYNTVDEQVAILKKFSDDMHGGDRTFPKPVAAAIGMTGDYLERAAAMQSIGIGIICVDVAHGHHTMMERCIKSIKDKWGNNIHIMAGNVATLEGFEALSEWGADSVRVGIGGGSICSTRLVTGHGMPTFQSILECARTTYDTKIIADGGIKTSGDIVKALAAGADFVMLGSMLAGTDETPGEVLTRGQSPRNPGRKYKVYRGMASKSAQDNWRGKSSSPEGISTTVSYKGPVENILSDISGGVKSGMSYSGCRDLKCFRAHAKFLRQTSAGQTESSTHILNR